MRGYLLVHLITTCYFFAYDTIESILGNPDVCLMSDTITRTLYLDVLSISAAIRHANVLREKQLTGNVRLCCPVGSIRRRRKERSVEMEPQVQQVFEGLGRVDTYITGENIVTSFYCTTDRSGAFPN